MKRIQTLSALFSFPGFRAAADCRDLWRSHAECHLGSAKKLPYAPAVGTASHFYDRRCAGCGIPMRRAGVSIWRLSSGGCGARCQGVKVERLAWLAQNPRYTQRFAHQVGILCRDMSNKASLSCCTCMSITVKRPGHTIHAGVAGQDATASPRVVGVDELSIKRAIRIASWSATWSEAVRFGLGALAAPRQIWISSLWRWGRRRPPGFGWR